MCLPTTLIHTHTSWFYQHNAHTPEDITNTMHTHLRILPTHTHTHTWGSYQNSTVQHTHTHTHTSGDMTNTMHMHTRWYYQHISNAPCEITNTTQTHGDIITTTGSTHTRWYYQHSSHAHHADNYYNTVHIPLVILPTQLTCTPCW